MNDNGRGNQNCQGRGNPRRNKEQRENPKFKEQRDEDKNVPMKYEMKQIKSTTMSVVFKFDKMGKKKKCSLPCSMKG